MPGLRAALKDIEHAFRQSGLGQDFREPHRIGRRQFGGFENHRISGRKRRGRLPAGNLQRIVPRPDPGTDTERFPACVGKSRLAEIMMAALDIGGEPAKEFERIGAAVDIRLRRFRNRLAGVPDFNLGEFHPPLPEERGSLSEDAPAFLARHRGPFAESRAGGNNGLLHIAPSGLLHLGQLRPRRRVEIGEAFPGDGLGGLAVDIKR